MDINWSRLCATPTLGLDGTADLLTSDAGLKSIGSSKQTPLLHLKLLNLQLLNVAFCWRGFPNFLEPFSVSFSPLPFALVDNDNWFSLFPPWRAM